MNFFRKRTCSIAEIFMELIGRIYRYLQISLLPANLFYPDTLSFLFSTLLASSDSTRRRNFYGCPQCMVPFAVYFVFCLIPFYYNFHLYNYLIRDHTERIEYLNVEREKVFFLPVVLLRSTYAYLPVIS